MAEQVAIEEGLFTWPSDDPRLLGSQCQDCGAIIFPMQSAVSYTHLTLPTTLTV